MSTCPSKDIHSIYLDNELPESYVPQYLAHIKSCQKCAKIYENMHALHNALISDLDDISLDDVALEHGWERLKVRMHYNDVRQKSGKVTLPLKHVIPFAAAAMFAFAFPLLYTFFQTESNSIATIDPISRAENVSIVKNNVVINGNIDETQKFSLSQLEDNLTENVGYGGRINRVSRSSFFKFDDVDVFRPNFDAGKTITTNSIKISIPGIATQYNCAVIDLSPVPIADALK